MTFVEWLRTKGLLEGLMASDGQQYGGGNTPNGTITPNQSRDKVGGGGGASPTSPAVGGPSTSVMAGGAKAMKKLMKGRNESTYTETFTPAGSLRLFDKLKDAVGEWLQAIESQDRGQLWKMEMSSDSFRDVFSRNMKTSRGHTASYRLYQLVTSQAPSAIREGNMESLRSICHEILELCDQAREEFAGLYRSIHSTRKELGYNHTGFGGTDSDYQRMRQGGQ